MAVVVPTDLYLTSWWGAKTRLRDTIYKYIPDNLPNYIEVFGGMASVLLGMSALAEVEVYNDLNSNLVNLFRCVQQHPDELARCYPDIHSRELFDTFDQQIPPTDIWKAVAFLYNVTESFGAMGIGFSAKMQSQSKTPSDGLKQRIKMVSTRIRKVTIEFLDYAELLKKYDGPNSFFYLDPPYDVTQHSAHYHDSGNFDHARLAGVMQTVKGKWLMSYNDNEQIRRLYANFNIITADILYSAKVVEHKDELLIANYDIIEKDETTIFDILGQEEK